MSEQKKIKLSQPLKRGETLIEELTLIKPTVNALKGLKMFDILQMDVDALQILLTRISQPVLNKADFLTMEVADFTELSAEAVSFLGKKSAETETETAS